MRAKCQDRPGGFGGGGVGWFGLRDVPTNTSPMLIHDFVNKLGDRGPGLFLCRRKLTRPARSAGSKLQSRTLVPKKASKEEVRRGPIFVP